jgi:hypothetical protein
MTNSHMDTVPLHARSRELTASPSKLNMLRGARCWPIDACLNEVPITDFKCCFDQTGARTNDLRYSRQARLPIPSHHGI